MEEQVSEMEKIAEADTLKQEVAEARTQIELDMKEPAQSTADAAGEVGMVQEMWNVMKTHGKTFGEITWKNAKATAAGGLSLVPLLGTTGTLVKFGAAAEAGKVALTAEKAAWGLRGAAAAEKTAAKVVQTAARGKLWETLKAIPRNPIHLAADPIHSAQEAWGARKEIEEVGNTAKIVARLEKVGVTGPNAKRTERAINDMMKEAQGTYSGAKKQLGKDVVISGGLHLMHKIDPYPDVPQKLALVAGFAEFVLPGANIVPAVWQLAHNYNEWQITARNLVLDMGKVVMKRFDGKIKEVKKPDVAQAAAVFAQPVAG
ncbi:MAG: hypothetical protein Q8L37_03055 [Candidatus Gottesmanbacteria bacterium]|nr:hypothetical protein [Candidatus Gottesmanbacteria bacterium]